MLSVTTFIVTSLYLIEAITLCPKLVGLMMALIGLLIILTQQLLDANKYSAHRPNTLGNWLKSVPTGKPQILSLNSSMGGASCCGKAHVSVSVSPEVTIEKKVEFLLRQLEGLNDRVAKIDDRVDSVTSLLGSTEEKLQKSIDTLSISIKSLVAGHVIGSYDLNLFGINITICGTLIQSFTG
ncbi:MAG: hypothetical protein AB7U29_15520 [Desulfobulbus sp.]